MSLAGNKTFRRAFGFSFVAISSAVFFAACGGGGGGGGTGYGVLADTSTKVILSGTVDSQSTVLSTGPVNGVAGATVNIVDSSGKVVATTTTDGSGQYSALVTKLTDYGVSVGLPSSKPAKRAVSTPGTLFGIVYVGGSDAFLNVNPGSTAAVIVLMEKLGVTPGLTGLGTVAGYVDIDLNATIAATFCLPSFATLADLVATDIANKIDPFTDSVVISDAQIVAGELSVVIIGSGGATSPNGTTVCVPPTNTTTTTNTGTGTGTNPNLGVPIPPAPTGVSAALACNHRFVDVTWNVAYNASGYFVYYDTTAAISPLTSPSVFVAGGSSTLFEFGPLAPGTYYFAVLAANSVGHKGPLSGVVSATTNLSGC